jgi:hypothetical protein
MGIEKRENGKGEKEKGASSTAQAKVRTGRAELSREYRATYLQAIFFICFEFGFEGTPLPHPPETQPFLHETKRDRMKRVLSVKVPYPRVSRRSV